VVWESLMRGQFCTRSHTIAVRKPGAASVSPPWLGRRICKNAFAKSRETADGVLTNAGADAVAEPRGAYASPLLVPRAFAGRRNCDFCDAQTYMHRSGGRDPAVVRESLTPGQF